MEVEQLIIDRIGQPISFYSNEVENKYPVMTGIPVAIGNFDYTAPDSGKQVLLKNAVPMNTATGKSAGPVLHRCLLDLGGIVRVE